MKGAISYGETLAMQVFVSFLNARIKDIVEGKTWKDYLLTGAHATYVLCICFAKVSLKRNEDLLLQEVK